MHNSKIVKIFCLYQKQYKFVNTNFLITKNGPEWGKTDILTHILCDTAT